MSQLATEAVCRGRSDQPRHGDRDSRVHVARAGTRTGRGGHAHGSVLARHRAVRDGDGTTALRGQHVGGHFQCNHQQASRSTGAREPRLAARRSNASSPSCSRRIGSCAIRAPRTFAPIWHGSNATATRAEPLRQPSVFPWQPPRTLVARSVDVAAVGLIAGAALAGTGAWTLKPTPPVTPPQVMRFAIALGPDERLGVANVNTASSSVVISPDGRQIAYVATRGGGGVQLLRTSDRQPGSQSRTWDSWEHWGRSSLVMASGLDSVPRPVATRSHSVAGPR